MNRQGLKRHGRLAVVLPVLLAMLWGTPAAAFQFEFGDVEGSLDSTISYGMSWRVSDRDEDIVGTANGGTAYSVNGDDGNLNYDDDKLISQAAKITSDLELRYKNFGLFVRGSAFYDYENEDRDRERTELKDKALDLVGKDADILDAYIWWDYDIGNALGQFRLGDQVLSWGESTFIQNGINVINPFDVSKLRVPGAELKEALVPVGMISGSIAPNEYFTFEGFYQYDWKNTEIDPLGSYWSTNDFASPGGEKVMLGFGDVPDLGNTPVEMTLLGVPRGATNHPSDDGQYGFAVRAFAPQLNNTEFGFYFMNYHSRLPVISGRTGTVAGAVGAATIAGATPGILAATLGGGTIPDGVAAGVLAGASVEDSTAIAGTAFLTEAANGGPGPGSAAGSAAGQQVAGALATDTYAKTARYNVEYPEDIKLIGVSFNTALDSIGTSIQGEYSFRKDAPLQVDDVELLLAALSPLYNPATNILADNQLGVYGLDSYIQGYIEKDVSQVQMTVTKLFGPTIGADQFTFVSEVGMTHVHSMPSKSTLRLEAPGTYVTGNPNQANDPRGAHYGKPAENSDAFADATSWGYRAVAKLDFNNAIGAVTLSPRIAWAHDVDGNSPGPGGNFLEDRRAITFGLGASYQSTWSGDLSYTNFFGASRYNLINDRDFVAFNIKYSF